jgi:hypothetical protein
MIFHGILAQDFKRGCHATQNDLDYLFAFQQDTLVDSFVGGNREIRLRDRILFEGTISGKDRHLFECCRPKSTGSAFALQGSNPPARGSLVRAGPCVGASACDFERMVLYCEHMEAAEAVVRDLRVFPDRGLHRTCALAVQTVSRSPKNSSTRRSHGSLRYRLQKLSPWTRRPDGSALPTGLEY